MKNTISGFLVLLCSVQTTAQVQVSHEPYHRPVLINKYIRLLDVVLPPNDTTQFHIHSTPSLFIYLSKNNTGSQMAGEKDWVKEQSIPGKAWYRSFSPDILIHRVANLDTVDFHVNDIEILSFYDSTNKFKNRPLPFPVVFENERSRAYQITNANIEKIDKGHGPLVVELVTGDEIIFHELKTKRSKKIKGGQYLYIEPDIPFYFTSTTASAVNILLFEIK